MITNLVATLSITCYLATGKPCANGQLPIPYVSCAVDRNSTNHFCLGQWLYIEGIGLRRVDDYTSVKIHERIDLFTSKSKHFALKWGKKHRKVYLIK